MLAQTGQDASARDAWDPVGPRLLVSRPTVDSLTAWVWGPHCSVKDAQD